MIDKSNNENLEIYAQNIVDTVREPLLILDATLRVRSANRAFYNTFQVVPKETEGRLIYELGNGQWDIPDLRTLLEDIVPKSSNFEDFELEHIFPVIGRRVMLLNARKLEAGRHGELLVLAMEDVTPRKRAEEELLQAGALQRAIFNSANFSSIATDAKGVIQIFNVGAEKMLGYTAADVMNKITPAEISDPEEVIARAKALSVELGTAITPGFEALVFKASRGIEDIYELTYIRKDGSRVPAVVSVTALRDNQNIIIGYLLIGTDNTARKQVEAERVRLDQAVRDQQFYTRSLIESNTDALMTTDPRGIITDVNKQMEALTGCTRDELIGAPFKDYFTDPLRAEAGIKLVLNKSKVTDYELTARRRDGKETVVSYNATTFHDRDRKLRGVFAAARDVTERKRAENELRQNAIDMSEADHRKDEFLAMLAHELRNPLSAICSGVGLLRQIYSSDEKLRSINEAMDRQATQMVRLIEDLLDVSRITSGNIKLRQETLDLETFISSAVESTRLLIDQRKHSLELTLPKEPLFVKGDPVRLSQVVSNLLSNAAKYTKEGGYIWLTIEKNESKVLIRVRDSGVGIPLEMLPKVFTLFTQINSSIDRTQGGLGIGLTIVRQLAEMHDGKVEAFSEGEDKGSEFIVTLPVLFEASKEEDQTKPDNKIIAPVTGRHILVVDDSQDAAQMLSLLLEEMGHHVRTAYDGPAALKLVENFRPDVIFLDIGLPGMDGFQLAVKFREVPDLKHIVLVALTGYGDEKHRRLSKEAGIDHHIVKPIDIDGLESTLEGFFVRPGA